MQRIAHIDLVRAEPRRGGIPSGPGEPVFTKDISEVREVSLGIDVPDDAAVVVVTSIGWRRSVYFDFGPFTDEKARMGPLSQILASQMLMLFGLNDVARPTRTRVDAMADGFQTLQRLLRERCEDEAQYQELLEFENFLSAKKRLQLVVPLALLAIWRAFDRGKPALVIFLNIPFAIIVGVFASRSAGCRSASRLASASSRCSAWRY